MSYEVCVENVYSSKRANLDGVPVLCVAGMFLKINDNTMSLKQKNCLFISWINYYFYSGGRINLKLFVLVYKARSVYRLNKSTFDNNM